MNGRAKIPATSPRQPARRGATAVEFAFVAPVFFVLVLAIIEFGRAMMVQSLLVGAAEQGARAGAMANATASDVSTSVNSYLTSGGVAGASTTVAPSPPSSALSGQSITVTVTVPYSSVSWLPSPSYLKTKTLTGSAIVQRETGQ
ncbi:MAG: pilus assembly protein [Planctomycetia bacterium]|nr:pilus assembly protein [Planctomycetia bacterium]